MVQLHSGNFAPHSHPVSNSEHFAQTWRAMLRVGGGGGGGKNNFQVDSRSFIHCIGAGSHYGPREMHRDAAPEVHVCVNTSSADPVKPGPKLAHLPDGREAFFSPVRAARF